MGPARFHCATLLVANGLSTYTPSEARSNCFGKTLAEGLFGWLIYYQGSRGRFHICFGIFLYYP